MIASAPARLASQTSRGVARRDVVSTCFAGSSSCSASKTRCDSYRADTCLAVRAAECRHFVNVAQIKIGRVQHASAFSAATSKPHNVDSAKRLSPRAVHPRYCCSRENGNSARRAARVVHCDRNARSRCCRVVRDRVRCRSSRCRRATIRRTETRCSTCRSRARFFRPSRPSKTWKAGKLLHAFYFIRDCLCLG